MLTYIYFSINTWIECSQWARRACIFPFLFLFYDQSFKWYMVWIPIILFLFHLVILIQIVYMLMVCWCTDFLKNGMWRDAHFLSILKATYQLIFPGPGRTPLAVMLERRCKCSHLHGNAPGTMSWGDFPGLAYSSLQSCLLSLFKFFNMFFYAFGTISCCSVLSCFYTCKNFSVISNELTQKMKKDVCGQFAVTI